MYDSCKGYPGTDVLITSPCISLSSSFSACKNETITSSVNIILADDVCYAHQLTYTLYRGHTHTAQAVQAVDQKGRPGL